MTAMYTYSAPLYDALYHFKDYAQAAQLLEVHVRRASPHAASLLDVGCGTGRHLEHLSRTYQVEGVDLSEPMLQIARMRCPSVTFHQADMTELALGRTFDVVTSLFSAVAYVQTVDRLNRAVTAMARHVNPGGVLIVEPWIDVDRYRVGEQVQNVVEQADRRISWSYRHKISGRMSVFDIHYVVETSAGVTRFRETHQMGLFSHAEYEDAFRAAGLTVTYDQEGLFGRGMYSGVRGASW
jgi:ubiquinone/menaquinone biosynthesis C-methylase UbiE